jgi:alpha-2-macroglobulin
MMGDQARAASAIRQAAAAIGYKDDSDWYQSPVRDLAAVINYAYEAKQDALARQLQARLEGAMRDVDSLNTQEQARLLQAAYQMTRVAGPVSIQATGSVVAQPSSGVQRWLVGRLDQARFVNAGKGPIYRTVTVRGVPTSPPAAASQGVSLNKILWTLKGERANLAGVAQGERIIVQVNGASHQGRSMMMVIDDALPAGFEVETVLGPGDAQSGPFKFLGTLSSPNVQEARDDRYVASLDVPGNKGFTVAYIARAVTPGAFFLPGAEARDMYRPGTFARTAGSRLTIAAEP